jgi:hypothetical protein
MRNPVEGGLFAQHLAVLACERRVDGDKTGNGVIIHDFA